MGLRSYDIETRSAEEAASVTAFACMGDDPEFSSAPEDCALEEEIAADSCRIEEVCSRAKVVEGVSVVFEYAPIAYSCRSQGSGSGVCSCGDTNVLFASVDWEAGCGFAQAYCESETKTQVGTPSCMPLFEEAGSEDCLESATCEQDVELDDETITTIVQNHSVRCENASAEQAACECGGGGVSYRFDYPRQATPAATCSAALDFCLNQRQ